MQNDPAELQKMVPDTQLQADLASGGVPNFAFVAPDQCHDMHGLRSCPDDTMLIQQGDAYVGDLVDAITGSGVWSGATAPS